MAHGERITDIWRNRRLAKVFELAGSFEEKPTPHRFRHIFVRILLEDRLTKILRDAFEDKPKPKLVAMSGGRG